MRAVAFLAGSVAVIGLSLAVVPYPVAWRLGAGALLLVVWGYGLWRESRGTLGPTSPVRLLPGHALLLLALGVVGSSTGFWAWIPVPLLTIALDLARSRSIAVVLYAILWFDLFALLHHVVALGRDLTGLAFALWSGGIALVAVLYVAAGARRLWKRKEWCQDG
ncbi:MAG: hypothetical protein BIP78_1053 [Candidatus Bipolaricaulis sibiricus]|uniref:Uncharacterized protein n=1 Tax=Bipolaricaulis sibiricus TaxID=2501609 RepID=A0A410FUQ4_BIPS1|nr:MAG: hypothetical protein BIP78_1053 [Candidatus Bipolaricaulis sibiricus]